MNKVESGGTPSQMLEMKCKPDKLLIEEIL